MSFRINILLFCLALLIGGGELMWQSATMAEWKDDAAAQAVQTWDPPATASGPAYDAYNKRWFDAMDGLRTAKWPYHDAGAAMIAFAISLAGALFLLKIKTLGDITTLATPRSPWTIYSCAGLGWFGYAVAAILGLLQGFDRFELPTWADSMVVPIVVVSIVALIGWIGITLAMWLVLRHTPLPVPLWLWRKDMPAHDWIYTTVAGAAVLIALEILRETYLYGHWLAVPCVFLCLYAAFSFRAVGIARGH